MLKIGDITGVLEAFAPLSLQMEGDNCGLIYGDSAREVTGVYITLDLTPEAAREARERGCNLIIEHHPSIFAPVKKFDTRYPNIEALIYAIKNDIAVYAAHTNVDFTVGGLNDYLMRLLGLENIKTVNANVEGARMGTLPEPLTLGEFAEKVKTALNSKNIRYTGDPGRIIQVVAAINGGGGGSAETTLECMEAGADIFLTSDFKYHVIRLAKDLDYAIMDIGHYDSEFPFISLIADLLKEKLNITAVRAERCYSPFGQGK